LKYYLIAGEASGDLHGSNLLKALRTYDSDPQFRAWGGDLMQAQGATLVKHYRELAFMGFLEVVLNLSTILGNLKYCKADIISFQPDVLVLIDYPGFNMRIAEFAKKKGIHVVYYISPQIWAWKKNRAFKLKRDVDRMLTILPFERDFYQQFDMSVDFVGHPLLDAISERPLFSKEERIKEFSLNAEHEIVALLPGSRNQEIIKMLPLMVEAAEAEGLQWIIAGAPSQDLNFYKKVLPGKELNLVFGRTYDILEIANYALVASGTATLETALIGTPEVVCYKGSWISYFIARALVKIKYISLVNLIMDQELVKELIQENFTMLRLQEELKKLKDTSKREELIRSYKELRGNLGGAGASDKAARLIYADITT
jgi:lipid-A-disaccharide synthase